MFSKLTSLFRKQNPELTEKFDHSNLTENDPSQCPFVGNKKKVQGQCPYKNQKQSVPKKKGEQNCSDSEDDEKPRGGCPFMGTSTKKKNPNLGIQHQGFDEPFVSKFRYYLSAHKLDFSAIRKGKSAGCDREVFDRYPIYLQHTLFFQGEDFKKVRQLECCSRFLAYEELREKGNKYFNKGHFSKSLDFYERAMSLFKWLEYRQPDSTEDKEKSFSDLSSMKSIDSEASKLHLNLNDETQKTEERDKDNQYDALRDKYKQFFVVYNDHNVTYFNGEEMEEEAEVDMRKSLLIQIYLNMAAAYMNLNHFSLALQVIEDALGLSDRVSQIFLRKAQCLILKTDCTLSEAIQAQKCIRRALQMKPNEKIFADSNKNILKMLNLGDAQQVYDKCRDVVEETVLSKDKTVKELVDKVYRRAKQIHQIQLEIIAEGKVPQQSYNQQTLYDTSDFKILKRMREKYIKVIDFYTEAQKPDQVQLAKKQFQEVLRVISQTKTIYELRIEQKDTELGGINSDKVSKRIQRIKSGFASDIYNQGKYNFHVLQWAIKEIVKEQKDVRDEKAKQEKSMQGNSQVPESAHKKDKYGKVALLIFLVPILVILLNYFLIG